MHSTKLQHFQNLKIFKLTLNQYFDIIQIQLKIQQQNQNIRGIKNVVILLWFIII